MQTYWGIIATIAAATVTAVGMYIVYSAITGKGIPEFKLEESGQLWVQYMRGVIGVGFILSGIMMLVAIFGS